MIHFVGGAVQSGDAVGGPGVDLAAVVGLAIAAGEVIVRHYRKAPSVRAKADRSPVTAADVAAEGVVLEGLDRLTPEIPVVSEERVADGFVPDISGGRFWLVDPLDGTREYLNRNGEFTVNIGLIEGARPVLGVIHAPVKGLTCYADAAGAAFGRSGDEAPRPIAARRPLAGGPVAVASRSHRDARTDAWLDSERIERVTAAGSAVKFCLLAMGEADVYPRFGRTMEWDTAAGHAILSAAGGSVRTLDGVDLTYGKAGFESPFFVARGKADGLT